MKVIIAGASGFLGKHLSKAFPNALKVSRSKRKGFITYEDLPSKADIIIHCAGESLFGLPTKKKFFRMKKSRISVLKKIARVKCKHILCFSGIDVLPEGNIKDSTKYSRKSPLSQIEKALLEYDARVKIIRPGIMIGKNTHLQKIPFVIVPKAETYWTDVQDIIDYIKKGRYLKTKNIVSGKVSYKELLRSQNVITIELSIPYVLIPNYIKPLLYERDITLYRKRSLVKSVKQYLCR